MKVRTVHFFAVALVCIAHSFVALAQPLVVIGKIPGEYVGKTASKSHLGLIHIDNRIIQKIETFGYDEIDAKIKEYEDQNIPVISLKAKGSRKYDVIYPGLIDLHGHNKQNVLPTWGKARGQFATRYEWRKRVANYKAVQSKNMNPWSSKIEAQIAAYRWSELQAMVIGTTYLQGAIKYDGGFAIHSVEDTGAYVSNREQIGGAGDVIDPDKSKFLWNHIRPVIGKLGCLGKDRKCYGKAVAKYLGENCKDIPAVVTDDVYSPNSYNWLIENREKLSATCDVPDKEDFLNYFSKKFGVLQHSEFIKRFNKVTLRSRSALVTHLAEGRRNDPYNWTEFQLLRLGGWAIPGISFIHGVGLRKEDFAVMAKNQMGLVWSPYSNFLLYGETVDIGEAKKAGVTIAIGSDWTPTGSKGVLHELKLAKNYVKKHGLSTRDFSNRELYYMATKYPAQIINHYAYEKVVYEKLEFDSKLRGMVLSHYRSKKAKKLIDNYKKAESDADLKKSLEKDYGEQFVKEFTEKYKDYDFTKIVSGKKAKALEGEAKAENDKLKALKSQAGTEIGELFTKPFVAKNEGHKIDDDFHEEIKEELGAKLEKALLGPHEHHGLGTLIEKGMGTMIVVKEKNSNPYTNLVEHAMEQEINLVVIGGRPVYGDEKYIRDFDLKKEELAKKDVEANKTRYEVISNKVFAATLAANRASFPEPGSSAVEVGKKAKAIDLSESKLCEFNDNKVLVIKQTKDTNKTAAFKKKTELDLDTYNGIVRYLGVALLSQSENAAKGKADAVKVMPPLYACDEDSEKSEAPTYTERLLGMVAAEGEDESDKNTKARQKLRADMKLFTWVGEDKEGKKVTNYSWGQLYADFYHLPYNSEKYDYVAPRNKKKSDPDSQEVIIDVTLNTESEAYGDLLETLSSK